MKELCIWKWQCTKTNDAETMENLGLGYVKPGAMMEAIELLSKTKSNR